VECSGYYAKPKEETELVKYKTIKCDALAILKEESISDAF